MNEQQWNKAYLVAQTLVKSNTDINELRKSISYLRSAVNQKQNDAGSKFFQYLQTLSRNGRQIGHSSRTSDYYRNIDKACGDYLKEYQNDAELMLLILGWTSRLMRYFKDGGVIGEITNSDTYFSGTSTLRVDAERLLKVANATPNQQSPQTPELSQRQVEIADVAKSNKFEVGQILEAKVSNIKGKEVTYELPGNFKLTVKEPKHFGELSIKQMVKVEITELRDNGLPKKVKFVEFI
ncbi:MAG: hypothetical protein HC903_24225 [Methylacidiphilales bacterium]|nr:hypothetical protein [Candidatus Methylacidiphilales bacterium]